jgi:Zn-dependent M28 family amino/carboxypeptidase
MLSNLVNHPMITFTHVHLIVLFTAGEESGLQGAKAFIQQHRWKYDVRRFINVDSLGGIDKAMLFQVKPSQVC